MIEFQTKNFLSMSDIVYPVLCGSVLICCSLCIHVNPSAVYYSLALW